MVSFFTGVDRGVGCGTLAIYLFLPTSCGPLLFGGRLRSRRRSVCPELSCADKQDPVRKKMSAVCLVVLARRVEGTKRAVKGRPRKVAARRKSDLRARGELFFRRVRPAAAVPCWHVALGGLSLDLLLGL